MVSDTIFIYTDASFSKSHEIAITGYAIVQGTFEHEAMSSKDLLFKTQKINEVNNIRAELRGVISALKACPAHKRVMLFTDCKTVVDLPSRRKDLEESKFISKAKQTELTNTDLYKEFYTIFDLVKPELHWVKGHTSSKSQTKSQENFSCLDKEVREVLRKELKGI